MTKSQEPYQMYYQGPGETDGASWLHINRELKRTGQKYAPIVDEIGDRPVQFNKVTAQAQAGRQRALQNGAPKTPSEKLAMFNKQCSETDDYLHNALNAPIASKSYDYQIDKDEFMGRPDLQPSKTLASSYRKVRGVRQTEAAIALGSIAAAAMHHYGGAKIPLKAKMPMGAAVFAGGVAGGLLGAGVAGVNSLLYAKKENARRNSLLADPQLSAKSREHIWNTSEMPNLPGREQAYTFLGSEFANKQDKDEVARKLALNYRFMTTPQRVKADYNNFYSIDSDAEVELNSKTANAIPSAAGAIPAAGVAKKSLVSRFTPGGNAINAAFGLGTGISSSKKNIDLNPPGQAGDTQ